MLIQTPTLEIPQTFRLPPCHANAGPREIREMVSLHIEAEKRKALSRARYAKCAKETRGEPRDTFLTRSREQWESYDAINHELCPWDPVYTLAAAGVTLATTGDMYTLTSAAAAQIRILESFIGGESTTSTVLRLAIQRSTGGATPVAHTPEKMSTRSPAATTTTAIMVTTTAAWTTQPTLSGNPLLFHAMNTFGGSDRWVPSPGEEAMLLNGEQLSWRSQSGAPICSAHVVFEEL